MSNAAAPRQDSRRGFSLLEMLIATLISMVIGGSIVSLLMMQLQLTSTQNRNMLNQERLRDTVRFLSEEISLAGLQIGEPAVFSATATGFDFAGDIDGNTVPDRVQLALSGSQLRRTLYSTADNGATWNVVRTDTLLVGLAGVNFSYLGENNEEVEDLNLITAVELTLVLDEGSLTTALTEGRVSQQAMRTMITMPNRML